MISSRDRGFLYGDGVFESFRTYHGVPFLMDEHLKRLLAGARALAIKNLPSRQQLRRSVIKELRRNKFPESYIKVIVTRGESKGHGLDPSKAKGRPTVLIMVEPQKDRPTKPWKVIISRFKRADLPSARLKTLCYVDGILAKMEAKKRRADEAILLDEKGDLAEGTVSNIFLIKNGTIYTPSAKGPILNGITRQFVINLARKLGLTVIETALSSKELKSANEVFVTSSGSGIIPVNKIGEITAKLIAAYAKAASRSGPF